MQKAQAMYLVREDQNIGPCWEVRHCPSIQKENCIVWEYEAGYYCWSVSGTFCQGEVHNTWREKMKICEKCEVFQSMVSGRLDR